MKMTLDFTCENMIVIKTDDDPKNFYTLTWRPGTNQYSVWWNERELVWEKEYGSVGEALANVVAPLTNAMERKAMTQ